MTLVFELSHLDEKLPDGFQGQKSIGTYSTRQKAEEAIERLRDMPGFRDYPERWHIREWTVDRDDWANGFDKDTDKPIP